MTDSGEKKLTAKRQEPSWGITKADLLRMHSAVVDKLTDRTGEG